MNRMSSENRDLFTEAMSSREGGRVQLKYVIKKRCVRNIMSFYRNVSKKYKYTYSQELMEKNVNDAYDDMLRIENGLLRRKPTLSRWQGYHMANTDKWYYAYTIDGDTVTIIDACHAQNMKENPKGDKSE